MRRGESYKWFVSPRSPTKEMHMRYLLVALLFPLSVFAAPFIVSDPDPAGAADTCICQEGTATPLSAPTVASGCKIDAAPATAGTHNYLCWFSSTLWGTTSAKVAFTIKKPSASGQGPQNLTVSP